MATDFSSMYMPNNGFLTGQNSFYGQAPYSETDNVSPYESGFSGENNIFSDFQASPFSSNNNIIGNIFSNQQQASGLGLNFNLGGYSPQYCGGQSNQSGGGSSMMMFLLIALLLGNNNNTSSNAGSSSSGSDNSGNDNSGNSDTSSNNTGNTSSCNTGNTDSTNNNNNGQTASNSNVWGDPHWKAADGTSADWQPAAGTNVLLLKNNTDGASITSQVVPYNDPSNAAAAQLATNEGTAPTVFGKSVINLGDNKEVEFNRDGTADEVNAQGTVISALQNGQTVTGADGNSVTYNATNKSVNFTFDDNNGDKVSGTESAETKSTTDPDVATNPDAAYINTSITSSQGDTFSGALPNLPSTFTGVTVNPITGAGLFKNGQAPSNFEVSSLYS